LKSKKTHTGQTAQKYHHWQWAKHMEFLKPHLAFAHTNSNLEGNASLSVNIAEGREQQPHDQSEEPTSPDIPHTIVLNQSSISLDNVVPLNTSSIDSTDKAKETQNRRRNNTADQQRLSTAIPKLRKNSSATSNVNKVVRYLKKRNGKDAVVGAIPQIATWPVTVPQLTAHLRRRDWPTVSANHSARSCQAAGINMSVFAPIGQRDLLID
jgi:hypothetical protein